MKHAHASRKVNRKKNSVAAPGGERV